MEALNLFANPADPTARVLGPDGRPWSADAPPGIKVPHAWTFGSLVNFVSKSYSYRWDEAEKNSHENAMVMRHDCNLMGLLRERQFPTEQMNWHIQPEDKSDPRQIEECNFLERIIKRTPRFHNYKRACLEALWYGRGGPQQALKYDEMEGRRIVYISGHLPVNGDKIQFDWDGTPKIRLYAGAAQAVAQAGGTVQYSDVGPVLKLDKPYWRTRFCIHKHDVVDADFMDDDSAGGIGGLGLRHWVYWINWMKSEITTWLLDYLERTGLGLTIYYYDATSVEGKQNAEKYAKENSRNTSIVWPRSTEGKDMGPGIERIETNVAGAQVIISMMKYFDEKLERFFIGQTLSSSSEGSGLGGTGVAKLHGNTKYRIIKSDCDNLQETLTDDLVTPLRRLNFPGSPYQYTWYFNVDEWDPDAKLDAINKAYGMGVSFSEDDIRQITGMPEPNEDDNILKQFDPSEYHLLNAQARAAGKDIPYPGADEQGGGPQDKNTAADLAEGRKDQKSLFPLGAGGSNGNGNGNGKGKPKFFEHQNGSTNYERGLNLEFYEGVSKGKSFLKRVARVLHAAEKRVETVVKKVFARAWTRVRRTIFKELGEKPATGVVKGTKPGQTLASGTSEVDVSKITEEIENQLTTPEIQEAVKPVLGKTHAAGSLMELDQNIRTRIGAYSGREVWDEPFSKLKRKLPAPLRAEADKFIAESFSQPWWDKIPSRIAEDMGNTLAKGLKEGDSIYKLEARLQNAWADLSSVSARRIARTECLTGDAVINAANVTSIFRRPYQGQMVKIVTESGSELTVTPNHPMLTQRGWIAAGELTESDDLLRDSRCIESSGSSGDENVQQRPSTIAEIYDSFAAVLVSTRKATAQPDFHGDGMDGYVDILRPDSVLRIGNFAPSRQFVEDKIFSPAGLAACFGETNSSVGCGRVSVNQGHGISEATNLTTMSTNGTTNGSKSDSAFSGQFGGSLSSNIASSDLGSIHLLKGAISGSKHAGSCLLEIPDNSSLLTDELNRGSVAVEDLGKLDGADAATVKPDHIASLTFIENWSGHVYNLRTVDGYYVANSLYTKNCTGALNAGLQSARMALFAQGLVKEKKWQSMDDEDVRHTHERANGQKVSVIDEFVVGEETCLYPGALNLSAEERINCRCVAMSVPLEMNEAPQDLYTHLT